MRRIDATRHQHRCDGWRMIDSVRHVEIGLVDTNMGAVRVHVQLQMIHLRLRHDQLVLV